MGKTISLKLTSDEERIIDLICERGVSHSILLRDALRHYFNLVDQKVYHLTGEEVNQKVDQVNRFAGEEVNQMDQAVYHSTGETVNQKVDLVDQKVNRFTGETVNQTEDKFLSLYIDQLNSRINKQESEIQEWKDKYATEVQYLKGSYNVLQNEYYNQVKDSTKRIDDKFDRIMFYLEESRKPSLQQVDMKPEPKIKSDSIVDDTLKVEKKRDTEKPKKGWIIKMYRM
jgi:vacuolar-type H+-ATPase subunit I/STV1